MAKSSFINKKFLLIFLLIIAVVGAGVGAYFLFRPKADLKAPYTDLYTLSTSEELKTIKDNSKYLSTVMNNSSIYNQPNQTEEKTAITYVKDMFDLSNRLYKIYESLDVFFIDNLLFLNDTKDLIDAQKNMHDSFLNVKEKEENCLSYINRYLTKKIIESNPDIINWQKINNYTKTYKEFIDSLSVFYLDTGKLFYNHLTETFTANKLSKYNILTSTTWLKNSISHILNSESKISYLDLKSSVFNIEKFVNAVKINSNEYYSNIKSWDNLLDNFNNVNFNETLNQLSISNYNNYIASIKDEKVAQSLTLLGKNYFKVIIE